MYRNALSPVTFSETFSDDFLVQIGLHQGSVLIFLFFITVMEALSRIIWSGCPEELLYAEDLALVSEIPEDLKGKLEAWKKHGSQKS